MKVSEFGHSGFVNDCHKTESKLNLQYYAERKNPEFEGRANWTLV